MALNLIKRLVLGRKLTFEEGDQNLTDIETAVNGKANTVHTHSISNVTGLQAALDAKIATSARGANNGVASLGSDGKVPLNQLPDLGSAANDMIFPTETLSSDDVGKLVVLKDGLAQLPEFTTEVDDPAILEITQKPAVTYFAPQYPTITITIGSSIDEDDQVTISTIADDDARASFVFIAKNTPTLDNHFAIGVDENATAANLKDAIEDMISASLSGDGSLLHNYHEVTVATNVVTLRAKMLMKPTDTNAADYWTGATAGSDADIVVAKPYKSWADTTQSAWLGYLVLKGLDIILEDETDPMEIDADLALSSWLAQNTYHSKAFFYLDTEPTIVYLPISATEMLRGIARTLPLLIDNTTFRSANSTIAAMNLPAVTETVDWNLTGGDLTAVQAYFEDPAITLGEYIPAYCEYPILGQVTSVIGGNCYISSQPLRTFVIKGSEGVDISINLTPDSPALLSASRITVLSPEDIGYVFSVLTVKYLNNRTLRYYTSPGFVLAYQSADEDEPFLGAFNLQNFSL